MKQDPEQEKEQKLAALWAIRAQKVAILNRTNLLIELSEELLIGLHGQEQADLAQILAQLRLLRSSIAAVLNVFPILRADQ